MVANVQRGDDPTGVGSHGRGSEARLHGALCAFRHRAGRSPWSNTGTDQRNRARPARHNRRHGTTPRGTSRRRPKRDEPPGSMRTRARGRGSCGGTGSRPSAGNRPVVTSPVIPAKSGIHFNHENLWIPDFAGMTGNLDFRIRSNASSIVPRQQKRYTRTLRRWSIVETLVDFWRKNTSGYDFRCRNYDSKVFANQIGNFRIRTKILVNDRSIVGSDH